MKPYQESLDAWEAIEEDYEVPQLPNNPTMGSVEIPQGEKKTKKAKEKSCLFAGVSEICFTRIVTVKTTKVI